MRKEDGYGSILEAVANRLDLVQRELDISWGGGKETKIRGVIEEIAEIGSEEQAEREILRLRTEEQTEVFWFTDGSRQAAIRICMNITKGRPFRTAAERRIAVATAHRKRHGRKTRIGWVKAHCGIAGDERADARAKRASEEAEAQQTITGGRLRQFIQQQRRE